METFCFGLYSSLVHGGNEYDYKTVFVYKKTSLVDSLLCMSMLGAFTRKLLLAKYFKTFSRKIKRQIYPQSSHRVAIAPFWCTFHHDGKINPAWWGGGGCKPTPFHYINHRVQSCGVRSSWEGRYAPPIYTQPLYVLCEFSHGHYGYVNLDVTWYNVQYALPYPLVIHMPGICSGLIISKLSETNYICISWQPPSCICWLHWL
jgi:hypothetical protein